MNLPIAHRGPGATRKLVLARTLKGQRAPEIARDLGVARQTVRYHLGILRASGLLSAPQERAS